MTGKWNDVNRTKGALNQPVIAACLTLIVTG